MTETEYAQKLVKNATNFHETYPTTNPIISIMVAKQYIEKYNYTILEQELNKLGFNICEAKDIPYEEYRIYTRDRFFIYKSKGDK